MGRNFGVPCEFLAYERPPTWTFDHALAASMLLLAASFVVLVGIDRLTARKAPL